MYTNENMHQQAVTSRSHHYASNFQREPSSSSSAHSLQQPTSCDWNFIQSRQSQNSLQYRETNHGLIMQIRTQTWISESHGLFDYESRNVLQNDFKCACMRDSYQLCRMGTGDVRFLPTSDVLKLYRSNPRFKPLAEINWLNGFYYLCQPSAAENNKENRLWLAIRHLRDRNVAVIPGDVLKLGRFRIRVKEAVVSHQDVKTSRFPFGETDDDDCETVAPPSEAGGYFNLNVIDADRTTAHSLHRQSLPEEEILQSSRMVSEQQRLTTTNNSNSIDHRVVHTEITKESIIDKETSIYPRACRICLCDDLMSEDSTTQANHTTPAFNTKRTQSQYDQQFINCIHDKLNPLIAPCQCRGSLKWVHLYCLRKWMAGRLNINNESVSFYWKSLECELCKARYPTYIEVPPENVLTNMDVQSTFETHSNYPTIQEKSNASSSMRQETLIKKNKTSISSTGNQKHSPCYIELFEIPRPEIPYAILAITESHPQKIKGYHIVRLGNHCIARLGRGHDSDVRVSDISVSRLHAIMRYQPAVALKRMSHNFSLIGSSGYGIRRTDSYNYGCFFIEDNRSKFGTLLELRQPFRLEPNFPAVAIQVNRTVITITLRRRWRFRIPACIRYNPSDIYVVLRQSNASDNAEQSNSGTALRENSQ